MADQNNTVDKEVCKRIRQCIPRVPFKGVDQFWDIGGLLSHPNEFQLCINTFIQRYSKISQQITSIGCFDARGFLLGPSIALAIGKPLFMLRKKNKMPNTMPSLSYTKEYEGDSKNEDDELCIQKNSVMPGDKVILIDDIIATGGTVKAGIQLVKNAGGTVVECGFVAELTALQGRQYVQQEHPDVHLWSLIQ